jgi:hypothetical protein
MAKPPFVLFGFDVEASDPLAATITADVQGEFPVVKDLLPGGPQSMHAIETTELMMIRLRNEIIRYFVQKDEQHGGRLRYCVFLIRMQDGVIE